MTTLYFHKLEDINLEKSGQDKDCNIEIIDRDIKLLTYNLFLRPVVSTNGNDYKNERLVDFIEELKNFDIIALQEVFGSINSRKTSLIYEAAKRGFYFYAEGSDPEFTSSCVMDGGIMILSRLCLDKIEFYQYSYGVYIDSIVNKGLLYTKVRIKDTYLHLFNTHLQASYYGGSDIEINVSYATRKSQIEEMVIMISECLKRNHANNEKIILCGDLNVPAEEKKNMSWLYKESKDEYTFLMNELNSMDFKTTNIYYSAHKKHAVTFGGSDKILYHPDEIDKLYCFDYIFEITYNKTSEPKPKLQLQYDSITIEHFRLNEELLKKRPYTQLSDHFGLSINIKYD